MKNQKKLSKSKKKAKRIVARQDIKKYLCPALQSVSNDVYEIAKAITPILVTLSFAGPIQVSLEPMLFAMIALIISRMGVAGLCVDYPKKLVDKE